MFQKLLILEKIILRWKHTFSYTTDLEKNINLDLKAGNVESTVNTLVAVSSEMVVSKG